MHTIFLSEVSLKRKGSQICAADASTSSSSFEQFRNLLLKFNHTWKKWLMTIAGESCKWRSLVGHSSIGSHRSAFSSRWLVGHPRISMEFCVVISPLSEPAQDPYLRGGCNRGQVERKMVKKHGLLFLSLALQTVKPSTCTYRDLFKYTLKYSKY